MSPVILLVEDDANFAETLAAGLREEAMQVLVADRVSAAERIVREKTVDALLLDLGLPDRDGREMLDFLRASGRLIPSIIISARADVDERIRALGLGADDYLVKPFSFAELVARLRALMRRTQHSEQVLSVSALKIDLLRRRATRGGEAIELTAREFDLLAYLVRHANTPVSRDTLARDVLRVRSRATPVDNVIEASISRLRAKLGPPGPGLIQTVRGIGYRFAEHP